MTLRVCLSPCPNDTFAIGALAMGFIPTSKPWSVELYDIDTLNQLAMQAQPGIFKISSGTYPKLQQYKLLPCGMALTQDAGPILVATSKSLQKDTAQWTVAVPGFSTTAFWLAKTLGPNVAQYVVMPYNKILEAVATKQVDAGVLIHEARFTYSDFGLTLICDFGQKWYHQFKAPLILSCLVASPHFSIDDCNDFVRDYRASLEWAWKNPSKLMSYITLHAQEKRPDIIQAHIEHFVSKTTHTVDAQTLNILKVFGHEAPADFCHSK